MAKFLRDEYGRQVPQGLAAPFQAKGRVEEWCGMLEAMPRILAAAAASMRDIPQAAIEAAFASCIVAVKQALPLAVCNCGGKETCKHCGGKGYLTESELRIFLIRGKSLTRDQTWHHKTTDIFKPARRGRSKPADACNLLAVRKFVASALMSPAAALRQSDAKKQPKPSPTSPPEEPSPSAETFNSSNGPLAAAASEAG